MRRCVCDELLALIAQEWIRTDDESVGPKIAQCCKGSVYLASVARLDDYKLNISTLESLACQCMTLSSKD
jgi:hypothetical protein